MFLGVLGSCADKNTKDDHNSTLPAEEKLEVQGHRGDRGNYPENSMPAFISAVNKGVDVLELDVVISQDSLVVVSHEPFMSANYMLKPNGQVITEAEEKNYNLFQMPYAVIKTFDSGSKTHPCFPNQHKIPAYKPLLAEVFDSISAYIAKTNRPAIRYNIEIKSQPKLYGTYQPEPAVFIDLVMAQIDARNLREQVVIQSFDKKVLQIIHSAYPDVKLSYLTADNGIARNLKTLGFIPDIYSPNYKLLTQAVVDSVQQKGMQLIPWTVNSHEVIRQLIQLGVDGIISDYPERVIDQL